MAERNEPQKPERAREIAAETRSLKQRLKQAKRQLAMVFDLNKCLGCQTCTIACKTLWTRGEGMEHMWWATVNTQPGRGTPRDWEKMGGGFREGEPRPGRLPTLEEFGAAWEFDYEEVFFQGKGPDAYLKPRGEPPTWGPNWDEDQGGGQYPNSFYFYLPRICNHCTNPACLEACPRNAIYKREEDGIVLIDEERCEGYRFCMEACPYKKIYFNHVRGIAQKCIFCFPRIEQGVAPACCRQCPGRLRFVGYLDDEKGPVYKLVKKWKVALPLHPEYGTEPNVYYVPPLAPPRLDEHGNVDESKPRIPMDYLRWLFGPEVDQALETLRSEMGKTRRGEKSELMDLLIVYRWPQDIFPDFPVDPATLDRPVPPGETRRGGTT
jgi:ethylbenzene hydroxylase subunit beta/complex iron-sulfur molybdoenzyme family reductase subunit beta